MTYFQEKLQHADRILSHGDYPVWWDGFRNVVLRGETADARDNPFLPDEQPYYSQYQAGAIAGESFIANL